MRICITISALLLSMICTVACGGATHDDGIPGPAGKDGQNGRDGKDGADGKSACTGPAPEYALIMRDFEDGETYQDRCFWDADLQGEFCMINVKNGQGTIEDCFIQEEKTQNECYRWAAWRLNKTIGRKCGAEIIHYESDGSGRKVLDDVDTDGDGISNYREYLLRLDPCSKNTYGSCVLDAELDGDYDGKKNGVDNDPYCNPDDKVNISDCI